ncbi:MAG: peptidylprolyl isomerase [Desulfatibacillaceae bacterium]
MQAGEDTVITATYVVTDAEGEVLDDIHESTPDKFVFGQDLFPSALYQQLAGADPGDRLEIVLSPEDAYGERDPDAVVRVRKDELPDLPAEVGSTYRKKTSDTDEGEPYTVIGILDDWVWLDKNHPWAGRELHYDIQVLDVARAPKKDRLAEFE